MKIFYEVAIRSSHGGFGMFEAGERDYSPLSAWASLSDLENEVFATGLDFLPIDEALCDSRFEAAGIEDIRGGIYGGDPLHLYAVLDTSTWDRPTVYYFGIETATVPDDYFTVSEQE